MTRTKTGLRAASAGAIGVLALITAGAGIAAASNGGSLVLGHSNSATKTTTLKDTKGAPLQLLTKKGRAPLKVNSKGLVKNLNAQELGGLTAQTLSNGSSGQLATSPQSLINQLIQSDSGGGSTETFNGVGLPPSTETGSGATEAVTLAPVKVLSTAKLAKGTYQVSATFNALEAVCWIGTTSSATTATNASISILLSASTSAQIRLTTAGVISAYCAAIEPPATAGDTSDTGVFISGTINAAHIVSSKAGTHAPAAATTIKDGGGVL